MAGSMSESLFLQDNLLSEDDWGSLNLVDLSDLTSTSSGSGTNDFCIGEDEARYQDYCSYSDDSEDKPADCTLKQDEFCGFSPDSDHQELVDELLQDLMHAKSAYKCSNQSDDTLKYNSEDHVMPRRLSSNTSSSAYSSCSSDPSTPLSHEPLSDQASCSSGEHSLECLIQDHEMLANGVSTNISPQYKDQAPAPAPVAISTENENPHGCSTHNRNRGVSTKSNRYSRTNAVKSSNVDSEETELEKAVRLACEETNRLLQMHRSMSGNKTTRIINEQKIQKSEEETKKKDILKDLCEKTILSGQSVCSVKKTNPTRSKYDTSSTKPLKRKASSLQEAIDRLQSMNKKPALLNTQNTTPFSRSALVNASAKPKNQAKQVQIEQVNLVNEERCIILSPQQTTPQQITLDRVTINPTQGYTITTNPKQTVTPLRLYVKQEAPAQPVINGFIQSSPSPLVGQKVYVTSDSNTSSNISLSLANQNVSIVKPEQLLCNGGQTLVLQTPKPSIQSPLQPVNITSMKPGSDPVILSQSDLSRLAAQGVIKFPLKKTDRSLKPVSESTQQPLKESKIVSQSPKASLQTVCDLIPSDAAGIISGTSVLVNGSDNQPQRGELDVKALRRHQRMIKNRASACQSRQRRKEYLKTLEDQVTEVAQENKILVERNEYLTVRVKELEIENSNLRSIIGIERSNQKKAACLFVLVIFFGINFFPVGLIGSQPSMNWFHPGDGGHHAGVPIPMQSHASARTGRHLLSLNGNEDNIIYMDESDGRTNVGSKEGKGKELMVTDRHSFWMDDLVREYKTKHLEKFLQILSETTSNSAQRMLRRKVKEELGIQIPLPVPRHRRIAYTPRSGRPRTDRGPPSKSTKGAEWKITNPAPAIQTQTRDHLKIPVSLPQPCEHLSLDEPELNETETSRVNEDLIQWAKRYTVDRQVNAKKNAEKAVEKKYHSTKAPSSRYAQTDNPSSSEIAVYTRPNRKFDDFLDAINRRNDTFYVVSLTRDHLVLPALVQNSSSRMKMALVMPAITSKERSAHDRLSDEYETMIHIECEVLNTRMFDLKRNDVPDYLNVQPTKPSIKTLDNASNDTMSSNEDTTSGLHVASKKFKNLRKNSHKLEKPERGSISRNMDKVDAERMEEQRRQLEEDAVVSDDLDFDSYEGE